LLIISIIIYKKSKGSEFIIFSLNATLGMSYKKLFISYA